MRKINFLVALTLFGMIAGLVAPNLAFTPHWMTLSVTPAFATGESDGGGGGENPNILLPRSNSKGKAGKKSGDGKLELPLPREARELGRLIVRGAAALREANGNIDFLNELERQVERLDGLSDARLAEVVRDIGNARNEQKRSRDEIRANMREAFAAIGVHLGNRKARAALKDIARAKKAAARAERNKAITQLGKKGLTMIDNAKAANAALNAVKSAMNSAFSYFN